MQQSSVQLLINYDLDINNEYDNNEEEYDLNISMKEWVQNALEEAIDLTNKEAAGNRENIFYYPKIVVPIKRLCYR